MCLYHFKKQSNSRKTDFILYFKVQKQGYLHIRPGKKIVLVLVLGGSILMQIKKNAGRKINTTPRKIQSPVFSSPVNHRNPRSSAF